MCVGNNLSRQIQVPTEVFNSLRSEVAIVVLPRESDANVPTRLERLHEVQNFEVGCSLDVGVGGGDCVFLDNENSLTEEIGEDSDAVSFGNEHGRCWSV